MNTPLSIWVLRLALAIRGLGLGFCYLWHSMETESDIFGTLLFEWRFPEAFSQAMEDLGMWLAILAALTVLLVNAVCFPSVAAYRGKDRFVSWRAVERYLLLVCLVWELLLAASVTYRGGKFLSQIGFGSNALRISIPLALLFWNRRVQISRAMFHMITWATVLTFTAHGIKAIFQYGVFTTMLIGTGERFGLELNQPTAESLLIVIGVVDLILAVLLLTRWRWVVGYMAFWGAITAVARMTSGGWSWFPETLLRAAHAGGPLFLFLEWPRFRFNKQRGSDDAAKADDIDAGDTDAPAE